MRTWIVIGVVVFAAFFGYIAYELHRVHWKQETIDLADEIGTALLQCPDGIRIEIGGG